MLFKKAFYEHFKRIGTTYIRGVNDENISNRGTFGRYRIGMWRTPVEVFARTAELKKYRLDVPQVTELAWELSQAGLPMSEGILTIEQFTEEIMKLYRQKSGA